MDHRGKGTFVELKEKEGDLKEIDNLDIVKAELERSAMKLKLYDEMLSETSEQTGRLWGPNPGIDWITEMRGREWSTFGPSSDRKVQDAQQKALEVLRKSVHELLDRQWDRVTP